MDKSNQGSKFEV